ncbi:MAG: hypothetical protein ABMA01_01150 [Chthoniobacteraceae bacterium]
MSEDNSAVLLPDVMSKVASLGPNALAAVHKFLLRLELAQLTEEIQDEAETLRQAGKLEPDLIQEAIRGHRSKHPYAG